jgi:peptide/nickel transport system substrate-binding protein
MRKHVPGLVHALIVLMVVSASVSPAAASSEGQMTWAAHISLAPTWFDPAETSGIITPFMVIYALHDAMLKPMPGSPMAPGLAESWSMSSDGLAYDFVLRKGAKFHNGEPVTAEDVKFSLERYRGASSRILKENVAAVETPDPGRVRIRLKRPWPDFMTFYLGATGAAWIVPKKYVEKVGDEGFKKAPVGAGPYKFVSYTPGVEIVFEAFEQYWRKVPNVKRVVLRSIPDETTRLAALKRGEVDIAYAIWGALAQEIRRTPGLTLKATLVPTPFWIYFPEQWDPRSPWHDRRVRLAVNHALDRQAINEAENLGFARITTSIIPATFDFFWPPPAYAHDPERARKLLAEAGYPGGFDAGDYSVDAAFTSVAEAAVNSLQTVGIRAKVRPLERAAFFKTFGEKKLKGLVQGASGAFGNAATRLEAFVAGSGVYAYGSYPDIDGLFREQAAEIDRKRREATLHRIQQLVHDKAMFAPIYQIAAMTGVGPRVEESGIGLVAGYAFFSSPYEDVKVKGR